MAKCKSKRRRAAQKEVLSALHNHDATVEAHLDWVVNKGGGSRNATKPLAARTDHDATPVDAVVGGHFGALARVPDNYVPPYVSPRRQQARKG